MRPVAARGAQVVAAEAEAVVREQHLGDVVVERGRIPRLKNSSVVSIWGRALLHQLEQRAARGVGGGGREPEHREGAGAADQLLQAGELAHGVGEPGAVEFGDLAGVLGGERVGAALGVVEQRLHARGALAGAVQQRFKIPGDPLDVGIGDFVRGHTSKPTTRAARPA